MAIALIWNFITKNIKWIVIGACIALLLFGYNRYQNKVKEISTLTEINKELSKEISTLQFAIESRDLFINQQKRDSQKISEINKSLESNRRVLNQQVQNLQKKFEKNDRDFGKLLHARPKLVEKIINRATQERLDCAKGITENNPGNCSYFNDGWLQ